MTITLNQPLKPNLAKLTKYLEQVNDSGWYTNFGPLHQELSARLESYLGVAPEDVVATEAGLVGLIEDLNYLNMSDRGYLLATFEEDKVQAQWKYVSDVKSEEYTPLLRDRNLQVLSEQMYISEVTS